MNQKAFTLAELLAVIAILAVVALITAPLIQGVLTSSREKACEEQVTVIKNAAKRYVTDTLANPNVTIPNTVSVNTLKSEGYLTNNEIKNPIDNKTITEVVTITYDEEYKQYTYSFPDICK